MYMLSDFPAVKTGCQLFMEDRSSIEFHSSMAGISAHVFLLQVECVFQLLPTQMLPGLPAVLNFFR